MNQYKHITAILCNTASLKTPTLVQALKYEQKPRNWRAMFMSEVRSQELIITKIKECNDTDKPYN